MDFGTNKTPAEIIKEGAFGGAYFRGIYSGYYCSNYYISVNKYGVKCKKS